MIKLDFFTKNWFPTNLIILIVVLIIIGFLVWGGLTNWKFIPKKQITKAPIPIPSNTYIITTAKLDKGIGYDNKGLIEPSNIIHNEIINSIYIDNLNFIIKIDSGFSSTNKNISPSSNIVHGYPLSQKFFNNVKVFGETNELIFLSNNQVTFQVKNNTASWTWDMSNYIEGGLKWDIDKKYKVIFTGNFPKPKKPTPKPTPTPSPTPKPTPPPTPTPMCKKYVSHNNSPLDRNICSNNDDCCNQGENIKCMKCVSQDASGLIPKFLQCQGTPKYYCQYNTKLPLYNWHFDVVVSRFAITTAGFKIVILGGNRQPGLVNYYSPENNTWQSLIKDTMLTVRQDFASVYLNNIIYAIGGRTGDNNNALSSVEIFNYNSDNADWNNTYVPNMKQPRYGHNSCILNGKIYVIGGVNNSFPNGINIVEVYDPITNSWITSSDYTNPNKPPMLTNLRAFGQAVTFNNKIYIIAGRNNKSVQYYDPSVSTTTWQDYTPLDNIRSNFSAVVAPSISGYSGDTIYVLGGMITSSKNQTYITDDVQMLDTVNNKWISITHLSTPRAYGGAVCPIFWDNPSNKNYIYIFGGVDDNNSLLGNIDKFDISTNSWEQI